LDCRDREREREKERERERERERGRARERETERKRERERERRHLPPIATETGVDGATSCKRRTQWLESGLFPFSPDTKGAALLVSNKKIILYVISDSALEIVQRAFNISKWYRSWCILISR
jgi:hypothetical protein